MHVSNKTQSDKSGKQADAEAKAAAEAEAEAKTAAEAEAKVAEAEVKRKNGKTKVIAEGKHYRVLENDVRRWKEPVKRKGDDA